MKKLHILKKRMAQLKTKLNSTNNKKIKPKSLKSMPPAKKPSILTKLPHKTPVVRKKTEIPSMKREKKPSFQEKPAFREKPAFQTSLTQNTSKSSKKDSHIHKSNELYSRGLEHLNFR